MEGILKVTPEELQKTAQEFGQKGTKVNTLTGNMMDLVQGLSSSWMGEASSAYLNKFKSLQTDIDKINRMIQEHAGDLEVMAQGYIETENANMDQSSALSGGVIS